MKTWVKKTGITELFLFIETTCLLLAACSLLPEGVCAQSLPKQTNDAACPKLTIDAACLKPTDPAKVFVTGRISWAGGQKIVLYEQDAKTVLNEGTVGTENSTAAFSVLVPEDYVEAGCLDSDSQIVVFAQSRATRSIPASRKVRMRFSCRDLKSEQEIRAPTKVTLTNLTEKKGLKASATSGQELTYKSSAPSVVSVSSSGILRRKKNGRATITIAQAGNREYFPVKKKVAVVSRRSTRQEQIDGAVAWAVKIANDNSFAYGAGRGAHHFGCYFCGTNYGPRKYNKPSASYRKTYCCNPFVSAAYAHSAKHPKMLAACRRGSGIGMEKRTFYRYGCWKCVGKPKYRKLKKGDVLVKSNHVAMYIGGKRLVEASGGGWGPGSIAAKHMSRSRYRQFRYVMRYKGY